MTKKMWVLTACLFASIPLAHADNRMSGSVEQTQLLEEIANAVPSEQDVQITEEIKKSIKEDAALNPYLGRVQIKTVNGIVHLKGSVASETEKSALEQKAASHPGVNQVHSRIQVSSGLNKPPTG